VRDAGSSGCTYGLPGVANVPADLVRKQGQECTKAHRAGYVRSRQDRLCHAGQLRDMRMCRSTPNGALALATPLSKVRGSLSAETGG